MDKSYGTDGQLAADALPYPRGRTDQVIATQGGKILASGVDLAGVPSVIPALPSFLARFTADGHLDPSFSGDGLLTSASWGLDGITTVNDTLELPDGRIAVAGWIGYQPPGNPFSSEDAIVVMLRPDGTLDPSWSGDGIFRYENPVAMGLGDTRSTTARGMALAVDPDGRLLLGGERNSVIKLSDELATYLPGLMAMRFTTSGDLDVTFGTGGVAGARESGANFEDMVATPDRGLVVAGTGHTRERFTTGEAFLARFGPDGHLDGGFGAGGYSDLGTRYELRLVAQGASAVVLGQTFGEGVADPGYGPVVISRVSAAGVADPSFGSGGTLTLQAGLLRDPVPRPDGSIIVPRGAYFSLISPDGVREASEAGGSDYSLRFAAWGGFLDLSGRPMFWRQEYQGENAPDTRLLLTRNCLGLQCPGSTGSRTDTTAPATRPAYAGRLRTRTVAFADKRFVLRSPSLCVPRNARFPVRVDVRRGSEAARRKPVRVKRVLSVLFSTGSQARVQDRKAPFATLLTSAAHFTTKPAVSARIALEVLVRSKVTKGKRARPKLVRKTISISSRLNVCA